MLIPKLFSGKRDVKRDNVLYFYLQYDTSKQIIFITFFSAINIAFDKRKANKKTLLSRGLRKNYLSLQIYFEKKVEMQSRLK